MITISRSDKNDLMTSVINLEQAFPTLQSAEKTMFLPVQDF